MSKRFGSREVAVEDLTLTVTDGELCILIGPRGCGKTTTLRMINRLIEPTSGRILIDDRNVLAMDPPCGLTPTASSSSPTATSYNWAPTTSWWTTPTVPSPDSSTARCARDGDLIPPGSFRRRDVGSLIDPVFGANDGAGRQRLTSWADGT